MDAFVTTKSPWHVSPATKNWEATWPELKWKQTDPLQEAADFYLLEALANNSFVKVTKLNLPSDDEVKSAMKLLGLPVSELSKREKKIEELIAANPTARLAPLADEAHSLVRDQIERLAPIFEAYVHMACGGELRHHPAIGSSTLTGGRSTAWATWRNVYKKYGVEALKDMAKLFREFNSKTYGDERWAIAAEVLYSYTKGELGPTDLTNKKLFVDRVFTLEHNGGCFLNKLHWTNKRSGSAADHGINQMRTVLNAHAANPPRLNTLISFASQPVKDLVQKYFALVDELGIECSVKINGSFKPSLPKSVVSHMQDVHFTYVHDGETVELSPAGVYHIGKTGSCKYKVDSIPFSSLLEIEYLDDDGKTQNVKEYFGDLESLDDWNYSSVYGTEASVVLTTAFIPYPGSTSFTITTTYNFIDLPNKIYGSCLAKNLCEALKLISPETVQE